MCFLFLRMKFGDPTFEVGVFACHSPSSSPLSPLGLSLSVATPQCGYNMTEQCYLMDRSSIQTPTFVYYIWESHSSLLVTRCCRAMILGGFLLALTFSHLCLSPLGTLPTLHGGGRFLTNTLRHRLRWDSLAVMHWKKRTTADLKEYPAGFDLSGIWAHPPSMPQITILLSLGTNMNFKIF